VYLTEKFAKLVIDSADEGSVQVIAEMLEVVR